jgi:hypothetical protein
MFGKYFKHILIMTLLAGFAYSLPQMRDAMVGAFGFAGSNTATIADYTVAESTPMMRERALVQQQKREQMIEQARLRNRDMVPAEEIVAVLYKAGAIQKDKVALAIRVLREHASSTRIMSATSTPPFSTTTPPFASTTRSMRSASSTLPMMRDRIMNRGEIEEEKDERNVLRLNTLPPR